MRADDDHYVLHIVDGSKGYNEGLLEG